MSSSPGFGTDVFISYTHLDDRAVAGDDEGWVARFDRSLRVRLSQWLGSDARVWRDRKLGGNDEFPSTLTDTVADAALFLMVVSPRYTRSEWCLRELDTFCQSAAQSQGLTLGNKSRIFKVLKMPVEVDNQPEAVQSLLGYEFYIADGESRRPREFSQDTGEHKDPRYWERLDDVAYEMAEVLQGLSAGGGESSPVVTDAPPIFLAATASDVEDEYLQIKRELHQRGHEVLPDRMLPHTAATAREEIVSMLERCTLAVHLVGTSYGMVPEGSEQSLVELQHHLAAAHAEAHPDFDRLIWMPVGVAPTDRRQIDFLETIAANPVARDVLQTDLDELKASILHALAPEPEAVQDEAAPGAESERRVYVIFHEDDIDGVAPLLDLLFDMGIEYDYPQFDGDESAREAVHQRLLAECAGAILFHGSGEEASFRAMWDSLRKAPDSIAKAVLIGAPLTPSKRLFRTREAEVLQGHESFPDEALRTFLTGVSP